MGIEISRSVGMVDKALDYRAARQDLIASNIANADTPFYKPRDISFENALKAKKAEVFHDASKTLPMAQTHSGHVAQTSQTNKTVATTFFRDGHMARNDGNSVDIDVETTEMSKNSVMFNALVSARKKDSAIFHSVIDASAKAN